MLLKVFATIASNSSGGVAGDFAPTVFAGAFAGFVFARCVSALFGVELPVGLFCLYGAAGAFAGIIHAPLMAIFLAAEIDIAYAVEKLSQHGRHAVVIHRIQAAENAQG